MNSVDRVSQMKEVHKEGLNLFKKKIKTMVILLPGMVQ